MYSQFTTHTDGRGGTLYIEWVGPDGQKMYTFPGDFPVEAHPAAAPDTLYLIEKYDGGEGGEHTRVTIYGKQWDAYVHDPVMRAVYVDGELQSFDVVSAHTGNEAYWAVTPEDRGKLVRDDGI